MRIKATELGELVADVQAARRMPPSSRHGDAVDLDVGGIGAIRLARRKPSKRCNSHPKPGCSPDSHAEPRSNGAVIGVTKPVDRRLERWFASDIVIAELLNPRGRLHN